MATIPQSRLSQAELPKDHVVMAKAIHDALHDELGTIVQKSMEPMQREMQESVAVMVGKALNKELEDILGKVRSTYEYRIAHLESEVQRLTRANEQSYQLALEQDHKLEKVKSYYEGKVESVTNATQIAFESVKSMIQAMPTPIINLPEKAINLTFPEKAIQVDVPQTIVNIPEKAIHVTQGNVVVPKEAIRVEVGAPNITVPKDAVKVELNRGSGKQVVEKSIIYDKASGRPKSIIETLRDE